VETVVASRWNVDSNATAMLMGSFYARLLEGQSVSNALTSARKSIRYQEQFSHPYYWAAFEAFGSN
jgi:CHAT domain-containing protein